MFIAVVVGVLLVVVIAIALWSDLRYRRRLKDESAWPMGERRWTGPGASGGGAPGGFGGIGGWGGGDPGGGVGGAN